MTDPSALERMQQQIATLFRVDANGRLLAVNEPGAPPAPRLFIGRTTAGNLVHFRHDLPFMLVQELESILEDEPVSVDLREPPVTLTRLLAVFDVHAPVTDVWQGPAWHVPVQIAAPIDIETVRITDEGMLREYFPSLIPLHETEQPCLAVLEHGQAVAACWSSRTSPLAAEAGVETAAAFRGRGHAAAVVAAWAQAVRASGRRPLYSTSWDNLASQSVARKLGLVMYGSDLHIT